MDFSLFQQMSRVKSSGIAEKVFRRIQNKEI